MDKVLEFLRVFFSSLAKKGVEVSSESAKIYTENLEKLEPLTEKKIAEDSKPEAPKYFFSQRSKKNLEKAHPDLQRLAHAILEEMDIAVICSYRGEVEQNRAFSEGKSRLKYPQSKHNVIPSRAIDIVPIPLDWSNIESFERMCKVAERKAAKLNIKIRLGRDFSFKDYPHVELI